MIPEFKDLNQDEIELMMKVPVYVSILVAGADDDIDNTEIKTAAGVIKLKPQKARKELQDYYSLSGENFEDKIKILIHDLPHKLTERNEVIISELKKLNDILPKLDKPFAIKFYESLKELAKKVAEASGGVFGFMAIGYEESKVIDLKMIKDPSKF